MSRLSILSRARLIWPPSRWLLNCPRVRRFRIQFGREIWREWRGRRGPDRVEGAKAQTLTLTLTLFVSEGSSLKLQFLFFEEQLYSPGQDIETLVDSPFQSIDGRRCASTPSSVKQPAQHSHSKRVHPTTHQNRQSQNPQHTELRSQQTRLLGTYGAVLRTGSSSVSPSLSKALLCTSTVRCTPFAFVSCCSETFPLI